MLVFTFVLLCKLMCYSVRGICFSHFRFYSLLIFNLSKVKSVKVCDSYRFLELPLPFHLIVVVVQSAGGARFGGSCFVSIFPQSTLIDSTVIHRQLVMIHILHTKILRVKKKRTLNASNHDSIFDVDYNTIITTD